MVEHRVRRAIPILAASLLLAPLTAVVLTPGTAGATSTTKPVTALVSVGLDGHSGKGASGGISIAAGGRWVAFDSGATNLVTGDTNAKKDVFVRDTLAASTVRVSVTASGTQGNGVSDQPSISANGRWVAFRSTATNLVPGDTNGKADIFLKDLWSGALTRVRVRADGSQATGGDSSRPTVGGDGTNIAFDSDATNLVANDANAKTDVFVRDLSGLGTTERVTVTSAESGLTAGGQIDDMTPDGRYVVFESYTTEIGGDATPGITDVFVRDRTAGTSAKVSFGNAGQAGDAGSQFASISDNGRYVAFQTGTQGFATVADGPGYDIFLRDRTAATTILVSRSTGGSAGNDDSGTPSLSGDGTKVSFNSDSTNLVTGDTNGATDVFARNLTTGVTTRASVTTTGAEAHGLSFGSDMAGDGTVAFEALAPDVSTVDDNGTFDVYLRTTYELGPFVDSLPLLQQNALDFTGANLSLAKVLGLNDAILNGIATPSSTIDGFVHGTFDDDRGPVIRLYWSFFHRIPDKGGLDYWITKKTTGTSLNAIATSFAKSSEFKNTYGALGDSAFVTLVYQNVLGRNPDAAGLDYWVGRLGAGVSRGEVMTAFSESSEGRRIMRPEVDTILVFLGMIRALPNQAAFDYDTALLKGAGGQPTEVLILALLKTSTYADRFA